MKEGYKKTEVGVIPKDWEVKKLGDIVTICYGKSQKEVENSTGKYKILGTGGLMGYADDFLWNEPSVLIGRKGTIDKPQYIEEPFWTVDTLFYTKLKNQYLAKWLYYYLNNIDLKKYNEATGVPSLSTANLNTINIITPPLKEQEKIAEILSTVDCQIDDTEMLIEKCRVLKKGLMQRLLSKGIGHSEFKMSEVSEIPVGWEVKKLEEFSDVIDSLHETPKYVDEGISMIRVIDINGRAIDTKNTVKVTEEVYNKFTRKYTPMSEDIIMSRVGSYGLVSYLYGEENVCLGQNIVVITTDINKKYLFYALSSEYVKREIEKVTVGSSQKTLSLANIKKLHIALPRLEEQNKIANVLLAVDNEIEEYENKRQRLEELKKGLMQQLLTGKVRTI